MSGVRPCIFGEVLYDHFPDGKRVLGGAPFNVAWHLQAFGQAPLFISRVGEDAEGDEIRAAMRRWGMDETALQTDQSLATGKVQVRFDDGEPHYDIVDKCAYDAIDARTCDESGYRDCGLLYHGSLALRNLASRRALMRLRDAHPQILFVDVNLRPPWWQRERVLELLHGAHWVKLNQQELILLGPKVGTTADAPAAFLRAHDLDGLILTRGGAGAELHTRDGSTLQVSPGNSVEPVDTVGAGDAFTSVVILGLCRDWPLDLTMTRAQAFASNIVGRRGATVSDPVFYRRLVEQWQSS